MSRRSPYYRYAVEWIAYNDNAANRNDVQETQSSLSVALVADTFGVTTEQIALEVHKLRAAEDNA